MTTSVFDQVVGQSHITEIYGNYTRYGNVIAGGGGGASTGFLGGGAAPGFTAITNYWGIPGGTGGISTSINGKPGGGGGGGAGNTGSSAVGLTGGNGGDGVDVDRERSFAPIDDGNSHKDSVQIFCRRCGLVHEVRTVVGIHHFNDNSTLVGANIDGINTLVGQLATEQQNARHVINFDC
jgi:hypothetical protein